MNKPNVSCILNIDPRLNRPKLRQLVTHASEIGAELRSRKKHSPREARVFSKRVSSGKTSCTVDSGTVICRINRIAGRGSYRGKRKQSRE